MSPQAHDHQKAIEGQVEVAWIWQTPLDWDSIPLEEGRKDNLFEEVYPGGVPWSLITINSLALALIRRSLK